MEFTSSALNESLNSNNIFENIVFTWARTAVYTDDDQSPSNYYQATQKV